MRGAVRNVFVLGTASHSGKSVVAAGLCRLLRNLGIAVAPFKAQNMALNSCVTACGGEMGRAQAVQAEAAGLAPRVEMNPILLKPGGQGRVQVVLKGKVYATLTAQEYYREKPFFLEEVLGCHAELSRHFEILIIEGAGSPVEMNLLDRDLVNLPLARRLEAPCLLVADIDRGGVFAALVGTRELCGDEDRRLIRAFIINKFRGEESLFADGIEFLERRTGWPCLGVLPHVDWLRLEEEDSVALEEKTLRHAGNSSFDAAVIRLPHLSNYTDFDPLEHSNVSLRYVQGPSGLGSPDLILLPGTKNTLNDLVWLRAQGFESVLRRRFAAGTAIMGICGGFQMLGREVVDPHGEESALGSVPGLGWLDMQTVMAREKITCQAQAVHVPTGLLLRGYEIHMGRTLIRETAEPFARVLRRGDSSVDETEGVSRGNLHGTYLHGIFENREFTRVFLAGIARERGKDFVYESSSQKEALYDRWAGLLRERLRLDLLGSILGRRLETGAGRHLGA